MYAADGSGTLTTPTGSATASSTGNTILFTYTAATGGISNGAVTVDVPAGWSAPSTTASANGYTTASTGAVSISSRTITVSGLTLAGGATATVTYGGTSGGGSGATAPSSVGTQTWQAQERSTGGGSVTNLASSPSISTTDTTPPTAPGLTLSAGANAYTLGQTAYFRAGVAGSFDVSASSTDSESGVASYSFPALGSGWSASGSDPSRTYSFDASAVDPSEPNDVTATNGAGLASSASSFTVTADGAAPITSISCSGGCSGWHTSAPVTITLTPSDSGSGTAQTSYTTDGSDPTTSPTAQLYAAPFTLSSSATVKFFSTDNVGNSESVGSQLVQVDTSAPGAPGLSLSAGANAFVSGSTVYFRSGAAGSFDLSASTSDSESGVASYSFPALGSGWSASGSDPSRTYSFDASAVDPSEPNDVTATNNAGLASSASSFTVTADGTAPSVTLDDPGAFLGGTVSLTATTSDAESGVNTVGFQYAPTGTSSWASIPSNWDTTGVADGTYDLRALATDKVGNQSVSPVVTRVVDNNSSSVSITAPGGAYLSAGDPNPYTVTADAIDSLSGIASVEFFECSNTSNNCSTGTWSSIGLDTSAPYEAAWTLPGDGNRALRAEALDNAGHRVGDIVNVTVDLTAPSSSLADPGTNLSGTVGLSATASDATSEVGSVTFQRSPAGGNSWTTIGTDTSAPYTASFNTTGVADGSYDLRVFVTDLAGNAASSALVQNLLVDNTLPSATMDDPGQYVSGTVNLTSTTADSGSGIAGVSYQYSPAGANSWTTTPAAWNTTALADGSYDLHVIATDSAGNSRTSAAVTTQVDNSGPAATQNDPGPYLRGTISLTGTASDSSGIARVAFEVTSAGGSIWSTVGSDSSAPYSASLDTTTLVDGLYDFRTVATDGAGNQIASTVVGFRRIDNTPPLAVMVDPGTNLLGTVNLTSVASDIGGSGVAGVAYEYSPAGANSWTATPAAWNTTLLADGLYDVRVAATDNAGNQAFSAAIGSRRVDNTGRHPLQDRLRHLPDGHERPRPRTGRRLERRRPHGHLLRDRQRRQQRERAQHDRPDRHHSARWRRWRPRSVPAPDRSAHRRPVRRRRRCRFRRLRVLPGRCEHVGDDQHRLERAVHRGLGHDRRRRR